MRILNLLVLTLLFSITALAQSNPAENFTAVSADGTDFELSKLKGKIVVLTFWSTTCPICEAEIPNLNKLAGQFKVGDVVFAAPTMNDRATVKRFLKDNPFDFIILPDSQDAVVKYAEKDGEGNWSIVFPAYFVIGKDGRIGLKTNGFGKTEALAAEIERLLSDPARTATDRAP